MEERITKQELKQGISQLEIEVKILKMKGFKMVNF